MAAQLHGLQRHEHGNKESLESCWAGIATTKTLGVNCAIPILGPQGNQEGSYVENSCRRIVGDAGESWGQTLLWNRRRRSESCSGRTPPKWRNRVCCRSS